MVKNILKSVLLLFLLTAATKTTSTTYKLDTAHTFIQFSCERFMVGEVTGKFKDFDGSITYDPGNPESMNIDVTIQTRSLDTDHETRDSHLRGETWLHVEKYPLIKFKSKKIEKEGDQLKVTGDLTIHGVTNEVEFPFTLKGPFEDPTGNLTVGLAGELTINRQDYGINFSRIMDNGEFFIGNNVKIDIQALTIAQ